MTVKSWLLLVYPSLIALHCRFNRQTWTHLVGMGVFAYFHLFSQHLPHCFPPLLFLVGAFNFPAFFIWRIIFFMQLNIAEYSPNTNIVLKIFPEFGSRMFHSFSQSCPDDFPIISNRSSHGFSKIPTCFLAKKQQVFPHQFP